MGNTVNDLANLLEKDGLKGIFKEGSNNHILFSGNLADELPEFNRIFHNVKGAAHNYNLTYSSALTTVGVFHNYSGYINAHEIGMGFKNIDEIGEGNLIVNFGNDNAKYLKKLYSKK